jgi:hypothetical protein
LVVQVEWLRLSENSRSSFWRHLGVCQEHRSCSDSTWSSTWMFSFKDQVPDLWSRHLLTESTCNVMTYSRKTTTHDRSQDDAALTFGSMQE